MAQSGRWSDGKAALPPNFTDSLKTALSLNPRLPQAYFQLGLVYGQQGKYAEEIRVLKKAISLDPESTMNTTIGLHSPTGNLATKQIP